MARYLGAGRITPFFFSSFTRGARTKICRAQARTAMPNRPELPCVRVVSRRMTPKAGLLAEPSVDTDIHHVDVGSVGIANT